MRTMILSGMLTLAMTGCVMNRPNTVVRIPAKVFDDPDVVIASQPKDTDTNIWDVLVGIMPVSSLAEMGASLGADAMGTAVAVTEIPYDSAAVAKFVATCDTLTLSKSLTFGPDGKILTRNVALEVKVQK